MHAFRVQIGDDANLAFFVVNKLSLAIVTLHNGLRACKASIERASLNSVSIEH